jgi:NADH-quinone oxidoreductase subunit L
MGHLLALVPAFPLLGFVLLFASAGRLPSTWVAWIGVGSVGISALLALGVTAAFLAEPQPVDVPLWTWMSVGGFSPRFAFHLDALSLVMMLVVTTVGFLIHLYSAEFMAGDEGYSRYFAYMNLFVAAMLVLVLASDLLLLYLGWEGVGLCSYLLIGFWYRDPGNGLAARKAFVVTRVGDTAMAVGLLLLFTQLGTSDIQSAMQRAALQWPQGSGPAVAAAALLLGGAVGKSAQVPLQVWLPDAMAGPSPVSALIHAATMVTAGVYLIARLHGLYELAPPVQTAVAVVGTATLLLAGFSALTQHDLKRILAYSTISQIGYMFLALGVGAWSAAIFHLVTHAFFKALLFLSAGIVIQRLGEEHDITRMGGLRHRLRLPFWAFLIGSASLAALPLVTAGFYSKDLILWRAWSSALGSPWLWAGGVIGTLLTALYTFRAVFRVFFGPAGTEPRGRNGLRVDIPLVVLSLLALVGGFVDIPSYLGGGSSFSGFMAAALPAAPSAADHGSEAALAAVAGSIALAGVLLAFLRPAKFALEAAAPLRRWWAAGWGFDGLYERALVRPYLRLARANRADAVDGVFGGVAALGRIAHGWLSETQAGRLRRYAAAIAAGAIAAIAISVLA